MTVDIKSYFDEVAKVQGMPKEWSTAQLMGKERELKLDFRVFSILTFEARLLTSTLEKNFSANILPLFKQQTMTISGAELKSSLDSLTTLVAKPGYKWVAYIIDINQWNFTFRLTLSGVFLKCEMKYTELIITLMLSTLSRVPLFSVPTALPLLGLQVNLQFGRTMREGTKE